MADPETGELRRLQATDPGWIRPPRAARCRWRVGELVGVHHGESGAHWSGIERCASIWACPVCAGVIRAGRADELGNAAEAHQATGGSFVFVTLTMRHSADDALDTTLDAALQAWRRMLQGKAWARFKRRFGVRGYVRAVEVTHGRHGWHPHIHCLFFINRVLTEVETEAWRSLMYERWSRYVVDFGGGLPSEMRGVDVRAADGDGQVVTQYLTKLQEPAKTQRVQHEITRADLKDGRGRAGRVPFELLDDERPGDRELWLEYFHATHGRRAITWSRGLRDELLPDEEEATDEDLLEAEATREDLRVLVPAEAYDQHRNRPDLLATALDIAEGGAYKAVAELLDGWVITPSEESDAPPAKKPSNPGLAGLP